MKKLKVSLCMLLGCAVSWALVSAYHVEPRTAGQSGWTRAHDSTGQYVSQVVTMNFDELDSAAGGCYVELFSGDSCTGKGYGLSVVTYPGGSPVGYAVNPLGLDQKWVRFKLSILRQDSIVRGKKLKFTFTRVFPDSLQFYYDTTAGYSKYGQMIAPEGQTPIPATAALAMWVCARLKPVNSGWWGMVPWFPPTDSFDLLDLDNRRASWLDAEQEAPIGIAHVGVYWDSVQKVRSDSYDFAELDREVMYLHDSAGIEIHARLQYSPRWASSRPNDTFGYRYYAPRNLWDSWPSSDSGGSFGDIILNCP